MIRTIPAAACLLLILSFASGQEEKEGFRSGIPEKGVIAGPFDLFNLNGPKATGRFHCIVCEFNLKPVVLIFTREPPAGKEAPLDALLEKLEGLADKYKDDYLSSVAVVLSPHARSSVSAAKDEKKEDDEDLEKKADKLVEEAAGRIELVKRLQPKAEKLKNVVVGIHPNEGPKGYKIDPEAETTVLYYRNYRVTKNWAFKTGELTEEKAAEIADAVEKSLRDGKKKPATTKKL